MEAEELHRRCFACREAGGLGLKFTPVGEDEVVAEWRCATGYESYPGIVHGGIVATVLDAAMTRCLLRRNVVAVTGRLSVEYHAPLRVGTKAQVGAIIERVRSPLFCVSAQILQDGVVIATAHSRFMQVDPVALGIVAERDTGKVNQ